MSSDHESNDYEVSSQDGFDFYGQDYQQNDSDNQQFDENHELPSFQYQQPQEKIYPGKKLFQQHKTKTNFQTLLIEQLTSNIQIDHNLCKEVGQKFLQILFIKIVNVILHEQNLLQKISMVNLQQAVVCNFLSKSQDIQRCLSERKLIKQIGKLFLESDYKQIYNIEKQLCSLIELKKTFFQQKRNKNEATGTQKEKGQSSIIRFSEQSITLPLIISADQTTKKQQKLFESLINISQIISKPELVIIDKTILPSSSKQLQIIKQQSKFAEFLKEQKPKNSKKKANYQKNQPKKPKRYKNFKKDHFSDNFQKKNLKYVQKYVDKSKYDNQTLLHTHGLKCYYTQKRQYPQPYQYYSNLKNQYPKQSQYPMQKQLVSFPKNEYNNQNQNITMTMIYQQPISSNNENCSMTMQQQSHITQNTEKIKTNDDSIDFRQLIKEIPSFNNVEKDIQTSSNIEDFLQVLQAINEKKQYKSVQIQSSTPVNEWNKIEDIISQTHKKQVQQYLLSITSFRNQLNLFCQNFGLNNLKFERKMQKKKFLIQTTLQFQSLYLNKKKIKIITEASAKNTKQATQESSKKMLRILYQNIQEMWKDFVKIKQKKGIKC